MMDSQVRLNHSNGRHLMNIDARQVSDDVLDRGRAALIRGWSTGTEPGLIIAKAQGALIWDSTGKEYIDCTAQAWSNNIGAGDPRVLDAVEKQMRSVTHARSNYDTVALLELSAKMAEIAPKGLTRVGYCLHGSMAVEMALKIALKNTDDPGPFIALKNGYHGRSLATMGISWPHSYGNIGRMLPHVVRVSPPYAYRKPDELSLSEWVQRCLWELREAIRGGTTGKPAAFIMEPIQGNGSESDFPLEYYHGVREICDEENVLLIWDEIQTGFGRTGAMWASDLYGVTPDILIFGKGIGGGFPLSGILIREDLEGFAPGEDALTFGQFPVSLAAASAAIDVMRDDNLVAACDRAGKMATARLLELKDKHPIIGDVRCPGLMIGIELVLDRVTKEPAPSEALAVYELGLQHGVIFGTTKFAGLGNVVKIKPSFVITDDQLNRAIDVFDDVLTTIETG